MPRRKREPGDFRNEIEAHIEFEAEQLREQGLSDEEANRIARASFGGVTHAQERYYEARRWVWWDHLWRDIRYALRMLRHSPGFTTIAMLTIALGIGATTAIFSVVDATLLHPLPYPHAEQLVTIQDDLPGIGSLDVGMSTPEWRDLERSGIFQSVAPAWYDDNDLTGGKRATRVRLFSVGVNYFALLGVKPELGSTFDPSDQTPGYNLQVVISHGLWQRVFGGDPRIIGKTVWSDTDAYRVIGVMPPEFHSPGRTPDEQNGEVFAAMGFAGTPFGPPLRSNHFGGAIGRLKPGLTVAQAQSRVDALVASLQKQFPVDYPAANAWTVRLIPMQETVTGNVRQPLLLLLGAVAMVLLIGCVNVANLLLARASARAREMAVRQALGAARTGLARQLLTESLLLSLLGGSAGVALVFLLKPLLMRLVPESLPRMNEISVNSGALFLALGASLAAGLIFGLAPAWLAGRLDITRVLKQEGRGSTGSGRQARMRRVLVVTEFALSLVLMIAAGLLMRSFWDLMNVRLGFNPQGVMMVRTRMPYPNDPTKDLYGTPAQEAVFVREVLRRSRALPGVQEVAIGNSTSVPLDHPPKDQNMFPLIFEGRGMADTQAPLIGGTIVTPEYFHLMGMTLLRGRLPSDFDNETAPAVAVINETMAQTYWPHEDPLGKRLRLSRRSQVWTTVVGVVADTRAGSLENPKVPQIYASLYQKTSKHLAIYLRGRLDAGAIPTQVRDLVQSVDAGLPVFGAETLTEALSASLSVRRFAMEMTALFALTALLLAALGIYGVISYMVSERTHEIGIRLALGARPENILKMVLRQGLTLAAAGGAVGLAGALIVSRMMSGLLYGVRPSDPATFVGVTIVLTAVALGACYIPARRAVRVDPIAAMHGD
jgi:predicted permease